MAYGRRRSTYRRKGRRGNRTLSTRNIFSNKGARSQASQIHALRKSVRRVQRQCRPEVKLVGTAPDNYGLALSDTATPGTTNYARFQFPLPALGANDTQRIGNKITMMNPRIMIGLQYIENMASTPSYYNSTLNNHGIQVRLIMVQSRIPLSTPPELTDILSQVDFDSQIDSMFMMRVPFKSGITSSYNIVMDRRMTVTADSPTKSYRLRVRPKSRTLAWEVGQTYPRGTIFCFVLQGGASFHRFEQGEDYVYDWNKADFTYSMELPFTDA